MKTEDLSDLDILDENSIVQTLRSRFNKDTFYVSMPTLFNVLTLNSAGENGQPCDMPLSSNI